jgi:hypothetical protein
LIFGCFGFLLSNAQSFPSLDEAFRLKQLKAPTGKIRMVLDTDTYNEVDDQFALAYAFLSKEKVQLEAVYAAPFLNSRSKSPADGMEKSYEEILRLLNMAVAWLINPSWVPTNLVHSPVMTDQVTFSTDHSRHFIRMATSVNRDAVFKDLFTKIAGMNQ